MFTSIVRNSRLIINNKTSSTQPVINTLIITKQNFSSSSSSNKPSRALTPLPHHGRFEYSAITKRPHFVWPENKTLAVYIKLSHEHFIFNGGTGGQLVAGHAHPDVFNYAWREWGNRVGFWRMVDLFDQFQTPVGWIMNTSIYTHCPETVDVIRKRGDEIVAHAITNSEKQNLLSESDERLMIQQVTDAIKQKEGQPPKGWLSPWFAQSTHTNDLLQESGYLYTLDWFFDDQPQWMKTKQGRLLAVPCAHELGDFPMMVGHHVSPREYADQVIDAFDEMLIQSKKQSLVFSIPLHTYLMGQPKRLGHLRRILEHIAKHKDSVWWCTPSQIADYYIEKKL